MNASFRTFCFAVLICSLILSLAHCRIAVGQQKPPFDPDASLSPAGRIIFDSTPTTPSELIRAIDQLVAIGEGKLANYYARQLVEIVKDEGEEQLLFIGDSLGPQALFRVANSSGLDETARTLCQKILAAMRQREINPQRLQQLAEIAVGDDLQARRDARLKLRLAGPTAANALTGILVTGSPAEQEGAREGLVYLGTSAVAPLLAVLETENVDLHRQVLAVLTQLADTAVLDDIRIATLISADTDEKKDLSRKIRRSIRNYLQGKNETDVPGTAKQVIWEWDDVKATLTEHSGQQSLLSAKAACRLARALSRISPASENEILETIAILQYEKLARGLPLPLNNTLLTRNHSLTDEQKNKLKDLNFLEAVFETALQNDYVPAAIGSAELLEQLDVSGEEGTNLVTRRGGETHPLVRAMQHKDRRVRLAACKAIVALAEDVPFAGKSLVSDTLRYFAASQGTPRVLIADRGKSRRQSLASMLKSAGYLTDVYPTGRAAMMAAQQHPDYVAMFVSFTIGPRSIGDVLHEFRTDPKTAGLPIGIIVDSTNEHRAENLVVNDPLSTLFFMPNGEELAARDVKKLIALAGENFVPKAERLAQCYTALKLFRTIIQKSPGGYDLDRWLLILKESMQQAEQAILAVDILACMEGPAAQVALADTAGNVYLPLKTRQSAASAFARNLSRYGIGLSKVEIQQQKDRYDSTQGRGAEEEALQWSILKSINQASKNSINERAKHRVK